MPLLIGIPWLAQILIAVFGSILAFFLKYFTKRIAIAIAVIGGLLLLTTLFISLIVATMTAINYSTIGGTGVHLFLPGNFQYIVSVWASARIAYWVYSWNVSIVQLRLF